MFRQRVNIGDQAKTPRLAKLVSFDTKWRRIFDFASKVSKVSSARMAQGFKDCPIDAAIIGIVDEIDTPGVPAKK